MGWKLTNEHLLVLSKLRGVRYKVSWAAECMDCWLVTSLSESAIKKYNNSIFNAMIPVTCLVNNYMFSNFLALFARRRFLEMQEKNLDYVLEKRAVVTSPRLVGIHASQLG